jgi:hypothetical protein
VAKATAEAYKNLFQVPRIGSTIPHPVQARKNAGEVLLKPASAGTGVIAGGPVRAILECAGIHDILSKSLGSQNVINVVQATVQALKSLEQIDSVAARRKKSLNAVAPHYLVVQFEKDQAAQAESETEAEAASTADDKSGPEPPEPPEPIEPIVQSESSSASSGPKPTPKNQPAAESKHSSSGKSVSTEPDSTERNSSQPAESKS